jgi:hypothetical protein
MNTEQVKASLAAFYPELRNAEAYTDTDGNVRFRTSGGSKGAQVAIYGDTQLPITAGMTTEQVKASLAAFYPELRNAEAYTDTDGNIRFRTSGGSKGC